MTEGAVKAYDDEWYARRWSKDGPALLHYEDLRSRLAQEIRARRRVERDYENLRDMVRDAAIERDLAE